MNLCSLMELGVLMRNSTSVTNLIQQLTSIMLHLPYEIYVAQIQRVSLTGW